MSFESQARYNEIIERISAADRLSCLQDLIVDMCRAYQLANIAYHAVYIPTAKTLNPILILTYDPAWVLRYKKHDYFKIDPVVVSGIKGSLPLDWSFVDHETKTARGFFCEADRFGVGRQGVTLPVRAARGERALFTVTSNMSDREWEGHRIEYMREFQIISHYFHDRAVRLAGYRAPIDELRLSAREMKCVELTAQGLTPKQIAALLGITDRMVRMYLQSACTRIGCASMHQAIAKLVSLEVINPPLNS
jgi:DNA-binding CsgD family transcriptional regulator